MPMFKVERRLSAGISTPDLKATLKVVIDKAKEMTAAGRPVRHIRTTYETDDGRCTSTFVADSIEDVRRLNDEGGIPYERIVPAMRLAARKSATE